MLETVIEIPFWFELTATITSAIAGALSATREKYDLLGAVIMAIITGLFGGVMRDIMLQDYGIYALQRPELILACVICAIVVFYFGRLVRFVDPLIEILDVIQVGLWSIVGTGKAISAGLDFVPAILMGLVTAVGGGIVRDVLMNRPVTAFKPGSLYGTAAVIAAAVYAIMRYNHILDQWSALICVGIAIVIRMASLGFGWRTKPARDLTIPMADALVKPVRALRGKDMMPNFSMTTSTSNEKTKQVHGAERRHRKTRNDNDGGNDE